MILAMPPSSDEARTALFGSFLSRLKFPQLFSLAAILFVLDLVIPDLIPFADEILLGVLTLLLGSMKAARGPEEGGQKPAEKDITPSDQ